MIERIHISFATDLPLGCASHYLIDRLPRTYDDAQKFIDQFLYIISLLQKEALAVSLQIALSVSESASDAVSTVKERVVKELLSKREKEVLRMMFDGYTTKEIARELFISFETVKSHRKNILFKTGSKNTAALSRKVAAFTIGTRKK